MADLESLRRNLTSEQRAVLNLLWDEFRDRNRWLPRPDLHAHLGESAVRRTVAELGTGILREGREDGGEDYRLTFLGILLADQGRESEDLLVRYLEYVRDRVRADARVEWVGSRDVEAALQLTPERSRHLRQLIRLSHWWGGGSGFGQREWSVGVPIDVEELPPADLRGYVSQHVLAHFLPDAMGASLRVVPLQPAMPPRSPFRFLRDEALAARVAADWHEAQDVCQVRGWKSCVLLCGGILETVLRAVGADPQAPGAGMRQGGESDLSALVQAAVRKGILPEPVELSPAIEEYSSLIRAGSGHEVRREDAEKALLAVRTCLRQLGESLGP